MQLISGAWEGAAGKLLQRVVGWYAPYFNAYSFVLARANEYQADAASAELVGAEVAARALKRTDVNGAYYSRYVEQTFRRIISSSTPPEDFAACWAAMAQQASHVEAQGWLRAALAAPGSLSDTHPPLSERLRALLGDAPADVPAPFAGPNAGDAWLGASAPSVRQAVQARWRERVAEPWKERHEESRRQVERLDELVAKQEPVQGEHLERLRLRLDCERTDDFPADVAAFIAAYPLNAMGPYLDGVFRLGRHDDSGLDCLERAIELDADATKPACERAHGYLKGRGDSERAEVYRARWLERDAWEDRVAP